MGKCHIFNTINICATNINDDKKSTVPILKDYFYIERDAFDDTLKIAYICTDSKINQG